MINDYGYNGIYGWGGSAFTGDWALNTGFQRRQFGYPDRRHQQRRRVWRCLLAEKA